MFNKEGIPFFTVIMPLFCILFISFLSISYNLKLSQSNFQLDLDEYKELYIKTNIDNQTLDLLVKEKIQEEKRREELFLDFMMVVTLVVLLFMAFFSFLMISIIKDVIKKYKKQV